MSSVYKYASALYNVVLYSDQCVLRVRVMVFNATFNDITAISWRSVLLVKEIGENYLPTASY